MSHRQMKSKELAEIPDDLQMIGWINMRPFEKEIMYYVDLFIKEKEGDPATVLPEGDGTDEVPTQTIHIATEMAFHKITNLKWIPYVKGMKSDHNQDFLIPKPYNTKIDVKGARNPRTMGILVKADVVKRLGDEQVCFVHSIFDQWMVQFRGYCWTSELRKVPTRDYGLGVKSHGIKDEDLHPMGRLLNIIRSTQSEQEIRAIQGGLL